MILKTNGKSKTEIVENSLCSFIIKNKLSPKSQLPSENRLCELFGVSRQTVRRALNIMKDNGLVDCSQGSGTYVRSLNAIKEKLKKTEYKYSLESMLYDDKIKTGRQKNNIKDICFVFAEFSPEHQLELTWHYKVFTHAQKEAMRENCRLNLISLSLDQKITLADIQLYNPAGVIFASRLHDNTLIEETIDAGIPSITYGQHLSNYMDIDSVKVDDVKGGELAAQHLVEAGCKKLALVVRNNIYDTRFCDRTKGFKQYLDSFEIPFRSMLFKTHPDELENELEQYKPDGIFSVNDIIAMEVMELLNGLKVIVPDDVKIVGFGDYVKAKSAKPMLTTLNAFPEEMGRFALSMLLDRIKNPGRPTCKLELAPKLIIRES